MLSFSMKGHPGGGHHGIIPIQDDQRFLQTVNTWRAPWLGETPNGWGSPEKKIIQPCGTWFNHEINKPSDAFSIQGISMDFHGLMESPISSKIYKLGNSWKLLNYGRFPCSNSVKSSFQMAFLFQQKRKTTKSGGPSVVAHFFHQAEASFNHY